MNFVPRLNAQGPLVGPRSGDGLASRTCGKDGEYVAS